MDLTPWPWPGRLDLVCREPLTVLDTAHNPDAAHALFAALQEIYPQYHPVVLYGTLEDKDWREYLQVIAAHTDQIYPLTIPYHRGLDTERFAASVEELFPGAPAPGSVSAMWEQAVSHYHPDQLLVICGSFHVAEAAYRLFNLDPFTRGTLEE